MVRGFTPKPPLSWITKISGSSLTVEISNFQIIKRLIGARWAMNRVALVLCHWIGLVFRMWVVLARFGVLSPSMCLPFWPVRPEKLLRCMCCGCRMFTIGSCAAWACPPKGVVPFQTRYSLGPCGTRPAAALPGNSLRAAPFGSRFRPPGECSRGRQAAPAARHPLGGVHTSPARPCVRRDTELSPCGAKPYRAGSYRLTPRERGASTAWA